MLKVSYIIQNKKEVINALSKRNFDAKEIINDLEAFNSERKKTQSDLEDILAKLNKLSKDIGELIKTGNNAEADKLKKQTSELKESSKKLGTVLSSIKLKTSDLLYKIPNLPHKSVPDGNSEDDNVEVFSSGTIPSDNPSALPHWELANKYDIIDFDLGNKITGSGFPVYKGMGAKLQRALISVSYTHLTLPTKAEV